MVGVKNYNNSVKRPLVIMTPTNSTKWLTVTTAFGIAPFHSQSASDMAAHVVVQESFRQACTIHLES